MCKRSIKTKAIQEYGRTNGGETLTWIMTNPDPETRRLYRERPLWMRLLRYRVWFELFMAYIGIRNAGRTWVWGWPVEGGET